MRHLTCRKKTNKSIEMQKMIDHQPLKLISLIFLHFAKAENAALRTHGKVHKKKKKTET